jgi:apolipoprotein D and lipocalin family protein
MLHNNRAITLTSPATWLKALCLAGLLSLAACSTAPPEGITAVTPFDVQRYQGKWFEIARMDHSFERGLSQVSATYQVQADGSVQVLNKGFNAAKNEWKEAVGRALFTGNNTVASLKVSFFGPFYGGYHVVALDQTDYRWALIVGPSRDYVWLLARDRQLPDAVRTQLLEKARQLGLAVDSLIWVDQSGPGG